MGKIVKYCSSCDEGFAERFGFCPDCGAPLQAFEMNPVDNEASLAGEAEESAVFAAPAPVENEIEEAPVDIEPEAPAPVFLQADDEEIAEEVEEPEEAAPWAAAPAPVFYQTSEMYADAPRETADDSANWDYSHADDGYYITVIQEKNSKQRNMLLLGASALMFFLVVGSWGVSLFQKSLDVGAIGSENSLAYLGVDVPMPVEDEPEEAKNDDEDGGGGGGGREDKNETSQGDLADQTKNPIIRPDARIYKTDNPEFLKQPPAATEGTMKFPKVYDRYGDPNSKFQGLSNGPGSGGGQGSGVGQGQGSGYGTGAGSGSGSGYGSGTGTGVGPGSGTGGNPPPVNPPRVTTAMRIISRPRASYTDAARTNAVTGNVLLKVTLLASGQIGTITPLTRLPHGLTEQAIAAARQIKFEPKKVNGVPTSVVVTFDYSFTIY